MDYLDHNKEFRQRVMLFIGYGLIGIAILCAVYLLFRQASGYNINKKGIVIQNGFVFLSSHPTAADIYVNGKLSSQKTNARLSIPSGIYSLKLARSGYFDWQHKLEVYGGDVQHYDYPFLFPKELTTTKLQDFASTPGFFSQSPDHRWLVLKDTTGKTDFSLFDLKNPDKISADEISLELPAGVASAASANEAWTPIEWADDNKHLLIEHKFDGKTEFILIDRTAPQQAENLNNTYKLSPSKLTLSDKKFDQYYSYDLATKNLQKFSKSNPTPTTALANVLAYKTYGNDTILYVTDKAAPSGKVVAKMQVGDKTYSVRNLASDSVYSIDLTKYDGVMYVVVGAASDNRAYIFKDPVGQREAQPTQAPSTVQVLRVPGLSYVGFSPTAQYIIAQNGNRFGVYDIENKNGYNYTTKEVIDSPQLQAAWMDGDRLAYVSAGKLNVFDFDYTNLHVLMAASSSFVPAFSPDYKYVYSLSPAQQPGQLVLNQSALRIPADR